ncbi:hypothetical protein DXG03_005424 [Asterophora parasitica]|uniref:Uncharacterized protein n=1 Tax=Asterophora parasitica TaxID=117018 RepID=A0A9P7G909_9AGAR|nr:hypothetical protein DXG03_005424 [Asterophora parasitica]
MSVAFTRLWASIDLTYLPKKYHTYVGPSVRRVYLDTARQADLQRQLASAQQMITKLEQDKKALVQSSEQDRAVAKAQASEATVARKANKHLLRQLLEKTEEHALANRKHQQALDALRADRTRWKGQYESSQENCAEQRQKYNDE